MEDLIHIDLVDVIDEAILRTRMELTPDEKNACHRKMVKEIRMKVSEDGKLTLTVER